MKTTRRDFSRPEAATANAATLQRSIGRLMAVVMATIGALAAGVVLLTLSSCTTDDDDYGPDTEWYLSGSWQTTDNPDEVMQFYANGTGIWWSSLYYGYATDFDYYCYGNAIYITMYPDGGAPFSINAYIDVINAGNLSITWPPSSPWGGDTIYYTRMDH